MNTFRLLISTPDGNVFDGAVVQLCLRGSEGDLAVMAGHIPFMTAIRAGEFRFQTEDGEARAGHVDGGLLVVCRHRNYGADGPF